MQKNSEQPVGCASAALNTTENFSAWTVIGTVTMGITGSLDFTDTNAASYPSRFYRTQERP